MHISDGVLPLPTVLAGYLTAGGLLYLSGRRLEADQIPRIAVMSAAFFAASLIHVRLGAAVSVHLILNGLVGILLGRRAILAIALGLLLQAIQFGHGGLVNWGVNTCIMGLPALFAGWAFQWVRQHGGAPKTVPGDCSAEPSSPPPEVALSGLRLSIAAGLLTGVAVLMSALLASLALLSAGESLREAAAALFIANLPILLLESAVTAFVIKFLLRVKPEAIP